MICSGDLSARAIFGSGHYDRVVTAHSSGTGSFFPRQSEDPQNRSNHSLIVLPEKLCLFPSLRCERLHRVTLME
ncbi:MAG: hypothetical protein DWI02_04180 [Planctomycetota bacterium]|nr:MAG: hypothetical protein DWI02_04180 [Planctomycetota bacterium]